MPKLDIMNIFPIMITRASGFKFRIQFMNIKGRRKARRHVVTVMSYPLSESSWKKMHRFKHKPCYTSSKLIMLKNMQNFLFVFTFCKLVATKTKYTQQYPICTLSSKESTATLFVYKSIKHNWLTQIKLIFNIQIIMFFHRAQEDHFLVNGGPTLNAYSPTWAKSIYGFSIHVHKSFAQNSSEQN